MQGYRSIGSPRRQLAAIVASAVLAGLLDPAVGLAQPRSASTACERLTAVALPNTTMSSVQAVRAGGFTPPAARGAAPAPPFADLPAFCRVVASTKVLSSDVKFEVWLPERWSGDVMPAGSSFWGGPIPYARMREILTTGAVTVGTDLGISGFNGPSFAADHPDKLENLKMEPLHVVVERARTLASSYYPPGPTFTVMNECGGGGSRDVLGLVQRFPNDLDAAVAVNFTNYGTRHGVAQMWFYDATHRTPDALLPASKLPMLHKAVLDACDGNDGVKDGVIENPKACKFDPAVLQCKAADNASCLTAGQVAAVRRIYQMPKHERTGEGIYGPMEPGSELGWADMIGPEPYRYAVGFYRSLVFDDPNWTYDAKRPNFGSDIDRAESKANVINHVSPDLRAFVGRGGKLLLVGGWVDDLPPQNVVSYYESVVRTMGPAVRDSVRLFMVPGMHHCFGGTFPGAYKVDFDPVQTVREWKKTGHAPDQIVVQTSGDGWPTRKRLVCAYPQVSAYKGSGDVGDPKNFTCRTPSAAARESKRAASRHQAEKINATSE
jgi:feruloyl esterase